MTGVLQVDPTPVLGRVVEMAQIGFGIADAGGTVTYANPRLGEILGRSDPVGLTLDELGLGADTDSGPDERLIQRPDGRQAWTSIERRELTDEPVTSSASVFTLSDIDSLK